MSSCDGHRPDGPERQSFGASYGCVDDQGPETSGNHSCVGSIANGSLLDSSTVGTTSFTVTAEDGAGNVDTVTLSYEVIWDEFAGLFRPGGTSTAGGAIPVKSCDADDSTAVPTVSTEGLLFDGTQYTYTWKTEKAWKASAGS